MSEDYKVNCSQIIKYTKTALDFIIAILSIILIILLIIVLT